jgi:hypothetical protein
LSKHDNTFFRKDLEKEGREERWEKRDGKREIGREREQDVPERGAVLETWPA